VSDDEPFYSPKFTLPPRAPRPLELSGCWRRTVARRPAGCTFTANRAAGRCRSATETLSNRASAACSTSERWD